MKNIYFNISTIVFILFSRPLFLFAAIDPFTEMAKTLLAKIEAKEVRRVAVLEFRPASGLASEGGIIIQEKLISALVQQGSVAVVERDRLDDLKNELTLGMTGLIDESTAKRIGKVFGVDGLVLGSLSEFGDGAVEASARLVLVETGEVVGTSRIKIKQTWVNSKLEHLLTTDPIIGWRFPNGIGLNVSTLTMAGAVLYENIISKEESDPRIIQIKLMEEEMGSATVDVAYFLPETHLGLKVWVDLPDHFNKIRTMTSAAPGHHVAHFRLEETNSNVGFWASRFLEAGVGSYSCKTPYQRVWMNPKGPDQELLLTSMMRLSRVDPTPLTWDKPITLFGDFSGPDIDTLRTVIIGGNKEFFELNIKKWRNDRIEIEPLSQLRFKRRESYFYRRTMNTRPHINPDLPYFVCVFLEGHSNLLLINFNPEGLPK